MVSGQGGQTFLEKILREAPKIFSSLPTLVFSLPTLNLITWVGKDPPAITQMKANSSDHYYLPSCSQSLSLCVPSAYQFVCIIISNHNILAVAAVNECQEFDKCFNSY